MSKVDENYPPADPATMAPIGDIIEGITGNPVG